MFERPRGKRETCAFDLMFVTAMAVSMLMLVDLVIRPLTEGRSIGQGADPLAMAQLLPCLCAVAFAARVLYADRLSLWLLGRFVAPRVSGFPAAGVLVGINVTLMAPLMCASAVLLSGAPLSALPHAFATVFPFAALTGFLLGLLLVRPCVMLVFSNRFIPWFRS